MSEELTGVRVDVLADTAAESAADPRRDGYDVAALRAEEFPFTRRGETTSLNNASTGPLPARTVAAVEEFTRRRAEPWRITDAELFEIMRRGRELSASLVGADPGEIALMPGSAPTTRARSRSCPTRATG